MRDLFSDFCTCFNDADIVLVAPVYAAGEEPIEGVSAETLVEGMRARGHRHVQWIAGEEALAPLLADEAQGDDIVIFLGAGNISSWAYALPAALAETGDGPGQ